MEIQIFTDFYHTEVGEISMKSFSSFTKNQKLQETFTILFTSSKTIFSVENILHGFVF